MSLLEQFDYLRNNDLVNRQNATIRIFAILDLSSKAVVPVASLDDLKEAYGSDVQYTYTRLIKGLASSRESARLGFSAALSELLRALPQIDSTFVLGTIVNATTPNGNVKGQETRDCQFGRLFGIQALCTSGILTRSSCTLDDLTPVLGMLYELAMSKGWLRESCANVILLLLRSLAQNNSALLVSVANLVYEMLQTSKLTKTIEGVAILIECRTHDQSISATGWSHGDPLHADNLSTLSKVLRDQSGESEHGTDTQTGTWKPKLHFAWETITRSILQSSGDHGVKFEDFWRIVVDEGLFSTNASHERKSWGLQLFNTLVIELPVDKISVLFSPNFLRTLANQVSQDDRYLNKAARNSISATIKAAEDDPKKTVKILTTLLDYDLFFDRRTALKPCEKLMSVIPADAAGEIVEFLKCQCNPSDTKEAAASQAVERRRQYVADCLLTILRNSNRLAGLSWILQILDFFVFTGYFEVTKIKRSSYLFEPELSDATRKVFRSRLQSIIGHLIPSSETPTDGLYITHIVKTFETYRNKKHFNLILKPDENILALIEAAEKKIAKLAKRRIKSGDTDQEALAFILLYSMTIVPIYAGEADAVTVLEDINECYNRLHKRGQTEDDQDFMVIMVDLLLVFLSRESVLYRRLVESVITVFADRMTQESEQLLLNVLLADESGQSLFDKDDDEEIDSGEDEIDDEDMSDEDEDISDDEEEEEEEEEAFSEAGADADAERDAALDAALSDALGTKKRKASDIDGNRPSGEGHESDFEADSDDDEDLMDDDEMLAKDAILENIFKRRKQETPHNKKQDKKDMRDSTNQLKRRVLDLLKTYLEKCPHADPMLNMLLPLLSSANNSTDAAYRDKAHKLLRQRIAMIKTDGVTIKKDGLFLKLQEILDEAERCKSNAQLAITSSVALSIVRALLDTSDQDALYAEIVQSYSQAQLKWVRDSKSRITHHLFTNFITWSAQWRESRVSKSQPASQQSSQQQKGKKKNKSDKNNQSDKNNKSDKK